MDNAASLIISESQLAVPAMERGDWEAARSHVVIARTAIEDYGMRDYLLSQLWFVAAARLALHDGDVEDAHSQLAQAMRARSAAFVMPVVAVRLRLELAKLQLATSETKRARDLLREIDDILIHRPALGRLTNEVDELRSRTTRATADATGASPLTPAELRLVPYLQTHLTLPQIGEQLFVSRHTIATQVQAIDRKLGVSSRHDAVQRAAEIGLLPG